MERVPLDVLCLVLKELVWGFAARDLVDVRLVSKRFLRGCDSAPVQASWRAANADILTWQVRTGRFSTALSEGTNLGAWLRACGVAMGSLDDSVLSLRALELVVYAVREGVKHTLSHPLKRPPPASWGQTVLREFDVLQGLWTKSPFGAGLRNQSLLYDMTRDDYLLPAEDDGEDGGASYMTDDDEDKREREHEEAVAEDLAQLKAEREAWDEHAEWMSIDLEVLHELLADEDHMPSSFNYLHWALGSMSHLYGKCLREEAMGSFAQFFEELRVAVTEDDGSLMNERCVVTGMTPLLCLYSNFAVHPLSGDHEGSVAARCLWECHVLPITILLLDKGADIRAVDRSGRGVLDVLVAETAWRRCEFFQQVVDFLTYRGAAKLSSVYLEQWTNLPVTNFAAWAEKGVPAAELRNLVPNTAASDVDLSSLAFYLVEQLFKLLPQDRDGLSKYCSEDILQCWNSFLANFAGRRTL